MRTISHYLSALLIIGLLFGPIPPQAAAAASLEVNTGVDLIADDGQCTLREAIISANTNPVAIVENECPPGQSGETDTIVLQNGVTYTLDLAGNDNNSQVGDLDIANNTAVLDLIITTADPNGDPAVISANGLAGEDRVLQVLSGANVRLENIVIQDGHSDVNGAGIYNGGTLELLRVVVWQNRVVGAGFEGGGIYNAIGASLTLRESQVMNNRVLTGNGGGISNRGALNIQNGSVIGGNRLINAGDGAGIFNSGGSVQIEHSELSMNVIEESGNGAAIANDAGQIALNTVTLRDNSAAVGNGGGIYNAGGATLTNTIIGGEAAGNDAAGDGGGIYNAAGGEMTIIRGAISFNVAGLNNAANSGGGGLYNLGDLSLDAVVIHQNRTGNGNGSRGGGIFNRGMLVMTNGAITENATGDGASSSGGGLAHFDGEAQITGTLVIGNHTGAGLNSGGGGISIHSGAMLVGQSVVIGDNNTGAGAEADGGGIWNEGVLELHNSTLRANQAGGNDNDGGGLYNIGEATLVGSTVSGNQASAAGNAADGGGIFSLATLTLRNVTISGNQARTLGGGIYSGSGSSLYLAASTVTDNHVENGSAGGLYVDNGALAAQLRLALIAGNTANFNPDCEDVVGTISSAGYNLIGIGSGNGNGCQNLVHGADGNIVGTSAAPVDALLGLLANNGGATMTHALLDDSPARDQAPADSCIDFDAAAIAVDQRGQARPYGDLCDIGAYEVGARLVYLPLVVR